MHYLVTGGCGFIGSHLTERLLALGAKVTVIDDLSTGKFANLASIAPTPNMRVIIGSILDRELAEPLIRDVDGVFHLASAVGVRLIMDRPVEAIETIFQGTDTVLRFAARYRRKVLLTSTSEVYGKSEDLPFKEDGNRVEGSTNMHRWAYACAKALDEFLVLAHHKTSRLPVVVTRLFNTVGPRQASQYGMVLPRFVEAALMGQPLTLYGDGMQTRCFCHVADVVEALVLAMESTRCDGEVINVGSNQEISIKALADLVIARTSSRSPVMRIPYEQAFPDGGFEDMKRRVPSLEKVGHLLNWRPKRNLDDIISDVVEEKRRRLHV